MNAAKEQRHNRAQLKKIEERVADTAATPETSGWALPDIRGLITAHPLPAVAIGAGLGLILGAFFRRLR